jgi:hypothetical protein
MCSCNSEITIKPVDGEGDAPPTGELPESDLGLPEHSGTLNDPWCVEMMMADAYHLDAEHAVDGSDPGDFCTLRTDFKNTLADEGGVFLPGALKVVGLEIIGLYEALPPMAVEAALRVVGVEDVGWTGASIDDHNYPYVGNYYTIEDEEEDIVLLANGDTSSFSVIEWIAYGDAVIAEGLNACNPDCAWEDIYLEIRDPTMALLDDCEAYLQDTWVCFEREPADLAGESTADAACAAGSGRFVLVPSHRSDYDGDGLATRVLAPVMISGQGTLTGAAWIEQISVVVPPATGSLRVVHGQVGGLRIGADDRVANRASEVTTLTSGATTFGETVSGTSPFVQERYVPLSGPFPTVDLEWTCGTLPEDRVLPAPTGFVLALDDLECSASATQKLILRIGMQSGEPAASVELYGAPRSRIRVPAEAVQGGVKVTYQRQGVDVEAIVRPSGPQGPTLDVQYVRYQGVDVCEAGVVPLAVP